MKRLTLLWILLFAFQVFAQQQEVTMNFSVLDKNKNYDGELRGSDIEIKQGKNKLQLLSIDRVTNENLDLILMIDTSGSQKKMLDSTKSVAIKFVENTIKNDKDRLAIVTFAQSVDVEQNFSSDVPKLVNTIKSIELQKLGKISARDKNNVKRYLKSESGCVES